MTYTLLQPWFLLLLPLALLPWWRRQRATVAHPDAALLVAAGSSALARFRWLPIALRSGAIALVVISLARPVKADSQTRVRVEGIAIQLVIDRSSSMLAMDFSINNEPTDRLTVLKSVVNDFVAGDGTLGGRPNDMVGAVTFAKNADGICPLTLDHDHLLAGVRELAVARTAQEDGTAIGDGVALAVERLKDVAARNSPDSSSSPALADDNAPKVKSRIMVLLTDGENNSGDIDPLAAAELAQAYGIKIYSIGVGTRGKAPYPVTDVFGRTFLEKVDVSIDEDLLKKMSETTGGRYFRATDTQSLRSIYAEIDRLERTETEARRYLQYADFAVEPLRIAGVTLPPLLALALLMAFFDLLLASTRFRTLT
ncbi:MAG: VWA domain-containing protein [Phycisphaerae bacterium]|nr:VWA domain-containing protein [Phycisphaerae bacterium]